MDDTLQELENELKRLTPRVPSGGLKAALERELGAAPARRYTTSTSLRSWKWAGWSLAGVAAVLAVAVVFQQSRRPEAAPERAPTKAVVVARPAVVALNRYEPVQATSVLYDLKEDGTTTLPDRSEGRQMRYRYVDTYTWKNPVTNASLRWSVPRDEVRVIRASLD